MSPPHPPPPVHEPAPEPGHDHHDQEQDQQRRRQQRDYLSYSTLGLEFALILGLFAWLGHFLDGRFGLRFPWLLLLGLFAGMGLGIYRMKLRLDALHTVRKPRPGAKLPPQS